MTTADASPNLLSRDGCYTLGVLKPCYSVDTLKTSEFQYTAYNRLGATPDAWQNISTLVR